MISVARVEKNLLSTKHGHLYMLASVEDVSVEKMAAAPHVFAPRVRSERDDVVLARVCVYM